MVMMANTRKQQSFCLFLGDLSLFCKEEDLEREFKRFGEITALRIKRSKETHKNLCYGFVEYSSPSSAVQAMNELDGKILYGRPLRIRWASSITNKSGRFAMKQKTEESKPVSIYVAFTSFQLDRLVNEEVLREVFSRFGYVVDVAIKQSQTDTLANRQKGYAFISFPNDDAGVEAALQAAREMIDTTIDHINFRCEVSRVLEYRLHSTSSSPPQDTSGFGIPMQAPPMVLPPVMYNYNDSAPVQQTFYPPPSPFNAASGPWNMAPMERSVPVLHNANPVPAFIPPFNNNLPSMQQPIPVNYNFSNQSDFNPHLHPHSPPHHMMQQSHHHSLHQAPAQQFYQSTPGNSQAPFRPYNPNFSGQNLNHNSQRP